jgi:hypothetical protein
MRVLVADGTSTFDSFTDGATQWFAVSVEPGKTYVIDIASPYDDLFVLHRQCGVFQSDGTSAPLEVGSTAAPAWRDAPSLVVSTDGRRCIVRTSMPSAGLNQAKRTLYIAVNQGVGSNFQIRVADSVLRPLDHERL